MIRCTLDEAIAAISRATRQGLATVHENALRQLPDSAGALTLAYGARRASLGPVQRAGQAGGGAASRAAAVAAWLAPFSEIARAVPGNRRTALSGQGGLLRGPDRKSIASERYAAIKAGAVNASVVCVLLRDAPEDPCFFLAHAGTAPFREQSLEALRARAECEVGLAGLAGLLPRWAELAAEATTPGPETAAAPG